jgi:Ca2+-binding EF-hand superfamily protein
MKFSGILLVPAVILMGSFFLTAHISFAEKGIGPPAEVIGSAYQEILVAADKNKDGKLSNEECMSISSNKKKMEKDCSYWDANGDGVITKDEYVQQVRKLMK